MKRFYWMVFFTFITMCCLPCAVGADMSAPEKKDTDAELEAELRWLRAEAEAEIVTVATKTRMTVEEAPSIVSVITGEEIRNMGARNLADVMQTVPGFDLTEHNKAFSRISIRGTYSRGVNKGFKMMIDGHALQPSGADEFERLPVAGISKIEVMRGPGSALYGTGAFLGVINISTYKGGETPSRISLEGGSFDTVKPSAEFSYAGDDFRAYLYADYYKTDGYDAQLGPDAAAVNPNYTASASREMTNDSSYHSFRTRIDYKNFYVSGFFQESDSKSPVGVRDVLTDEDDVDILYAYSEAGFRLPLDDRGSLVMKMYADHSDYKMIYEILPEEAAANGKYTGFPTDEGIYEGTATKYTVLGGEITGDYEMYPGIRFAGGASYENVRQYDIKRYANYNNTGYDLEIDGGTYSPDEYFSGGLTDISEEMKGKYEKAESDIFALYGQGTADMKSLFFPDSTLKALSLTAGMRYDHYRNSGEISGDSTFSAVNARLGLAYSPIENLWFKLLYGEAFRAPSLSEAYPFDTSINTENKDLQPEKIHTYEMLIGYRFAKNITASLTGFYIRNKEMLQYQQEKDGTSGFRNVGKTESVGAELEFKAGFGKNRYAFLNFTWQDVKDVTNMEIPGTDQRQEDFGIRGIPRFCGNIGVNYGITENVIANITLNYRGEKERAGDKVWNGEKLVPKDQRDPVEAYWLLNTSMTFRDFFAKGVEFQISGFNLLDKDWKFPDVFGTIPEDIPSPGRSFIGRISYSF